MKRARYLLTLDGVGIAKSTAIRAKAIRSRRWWLERCPGLDLALERLAPAPS